MGSRSGAEWKIRDGSDVGAGEVSAQGGRDGLDDVRIELSALATVQFTQGCQEGAGGLVGSFRGYGHQGVGDGQDSGTDGDILATLVDRSTTSVEWGVMITDVVGGFGIGTQKGARGRTLFRVASDQ